MILPIQGVFLTAPPPPKKKERELKYVKRRFGKYAPTHIVLDTSNLALVNFFVIKKNTLYLNNRNPPRVEWKSLGGLSKQLLHSLQNLQKTDVTI